MDDNSIKLVSALADLIKALVWPALFVWLVLRFRNQVSELLTRLMSLKVAGSEFGFQPPLGKLPAPVQSRRAIELKVGPDGFLTSESLRAVFTESVLLDQSE